MKIESFNNHQYFKGLNLSKVSDFHLKNYIMPNLPTLKNLANEADIFLNSHWNPYLQCPILEYAVKHLNGNNDVLRWSILSSGYSNLSKDTIIKKITDAIKVLS